MSEWTLNEERKPLTRRQYVQLFMAQDGKCACCGQRLAVKGTAEVWDEHLKPLSMGGSNELENRALYCKPCAKAKTKAEAPERAKSNRVRDKHIGAKKSKTPLPGSRNHPSGLRKRMNNTIERW